jgi:hypothetical protein
LAASELNRLKKLGLGLGLGKPSQEKYSDTRSAGKRRAKRKVLKTRTARGLQDKGRRESLTRFGAKTTKVKEEFIRRFLILCVCVYLNHDEFESREIREYEEVSGE